MTIANQSVPDSLTIVNYVNDTLAKNIPAGVQALEKKQLFMDAGLRPVVVSSLKLLKHDNENFSRFWRVRLPRRHSLKLLMW
jgi:hypothetical protein